jgi:CBS domain-containing protein
MFLYFSKLLNEPVMDKNREFLGKLFEIITAPTEVYPKAGAIVICRGFLKKRYAVVLWNNVLEIDKRGIYLKCRKESLRFEDAVNYQDKLALRRDILDQQVIDTHDYNVIRVNDIHLLEVNRDLMLAHVDIGGKGLLRRLGLEKIINALVKVFFKNSDYSAKERLVPWKYVQPLSINPVSKTIKINIPQKDFRTIPPAELGDIMMDLDPIQKIHIFRTLEIKTQSKIFGHLDVDTQRAIIEEIGPKAGAEILKEMPDDEATDFLERIPRRSVNLILDKMETKTGKKLSRLLGYASDSAGGLMTTNYIAIQKDTTVERALNMVKEMTFSVEPIQYVYIIDENRSLLGLTNLRRLISASSQDPIISVSFPNTVYVRLGDGVNEVAYLMEKYKCQVLPVVNDDHILQGIITIDDILSQVIAIAWRKTRKKVPRTL